MHTANNNSTEILSNGLPASPASVIVGMSGGVDSSVAALLLKENGHKVSAVFMKNWDDDDEQCTSRQDYRDAKAVCDRLGIALTTVNFEREYWDRVFTHFLDEYSAGRTPNPDILCNKEIKFKAFLAHAKSLGCDYIATGHYARSDKQGHNGRARLLRGLDNNKDQSYFLYTLGQQELDAALFPVGALEKSEVRQLAENAGFHVFSKKDSTGICFIGERKFASFLAEYLPAQPGAIETLAGKTVGKHNGLMYYTIGQRQGLGIGGSKEGDEQPWYVLDKRLSTNTLIVGQGHNHPTLFKSSLGAHDLHWCSGLQPDYPLHCTAKIRYRQADQNVTVNGNGDDGLQATFDEPVRAITPGQSAVFYDGDVCLGGAVISDYHATIENGVSHPPMNSSTCGEGNSTSQKNLSDPVDP